MRAEHIDCGYAPIPISDQKLEPQEFMYYLYLPISLKYSYGVSLPDRLRFVNPLITLVCRDADWVDKYIYLTVKSMFVDSQCIGNRGGWHIDGFQSNGDLNYIWYSENPTEFAVQEFVNIPNDDEQSMVEIEQQIDHSKIKTYPAGWLLKLDEGVVHRATPNARACFRTFIKITVSDHQFKGFGNSRNYLLDYDWPVSKRKTLERNLDHG